ncbi:MAG TPA: NHL repeat-containing protein [Spirochaetia bacterium]|nr:NHL repeat-containing protein [Spirochaetia bacterium]
MAKREQGKPRFARVLAVLALWAAAAGLGAAPQAKLAWEAKGPPGDPLGYVGAVAVAPDGKVWAADASGRFFIFDEGGAFLETWGSAGSGPGQFRFIVDTGQINWERDVSAEILFLPDGSFYVRDWGNNRVQRFSSARRFLGAFGSGESPGEAPTGIAVRNGNELLACFAGRTDLQRFSLEGAYRGSLVLDLVDVEFVQTTSGVAVDSAGTIYVATKFRGQGGVRPRGRILAFDPKGASRGLFGVQEAEFSGLSFDFFLRLGPDGRLYAADEWNQRLIAFGADRKPFFVYGEAGSGPGRFNRPSSLAFGPKGELYVADLLNRRIQKFILSGL